MKCHGYCPVTIERFHLTTAWRHGGHVTVSWSMYFIPIGKWRLFIGKHFLLFASNTKHGCREIALQHKQFKTHCVFSIKNRGLTSERKWTCLTEYGCDNSVALVTGVYSATLFQNCMFFNWCGMAVWKSSSVFGVWFFPTIIIVEQKWFQTFDICLSYHKMCIEVCYNADLIPGVNKKKLLNLALNRDRIPKLS